MVKESTRESGNLKKKRKTANNNDNESEIDVYKKTIEFEEKEALNRPSEADAELYFNTCKVIRQLLSEIGELKMKNTNEARQKIQEKTSEVCMRIVLLKKLNRMEKVRLVFPKELLANEKQKVDSINLQYQNLLYEANHLLFEFKKCFQFKSKDESIELVPLEEFLEKAPESLTKKFQNYDEKDETMKHELRLARLEWELQQRIHLAEMCKNLEQEEKNLLSGISECKNRLNKLSPLLANVMESTKPVQEHLGLRIDKIQEEHKLASLLPDPLYLFYANVDAYRQVNDPSMNIAIVGDQDEAVQWKETQQQQQQHDKDIETIVLDEDDNNELDETSETEQETQENEETVDVIIKKRRHRKSVHEIDPLVEKKKKLFELHPLSIELIINIKLSELSIKIKFNYYTKLQLVTVKSIVNIPNNITTNTAREVLTNECILNELIENDFGLISPNPCTSYQLKKVGINSFNNLINELGYVYIWAQKVCGLDYLIKNKTNSDKISQTNVEIIMKTIKKRLKFRYALANQLEMFEKNIIPSVPESIKLPTTAISSLTKWNSLNYQEFCEIKFTSNLIDSEIVNGNELFYLATITRSNASLHAYIVIKNNYPMISPIFALSLNYNGVYNSQSDDNIRDIERSINVGWNYGNTSADWLLSAQLIYLCSCLDVYLETENPTEFPKNMMFIKPFCGRNRRKPFKFKNIGVGVFIQ